MENFVISHDEWKYLIDVLQNPEVDTYVNKELFESLELKKYIDFDFDGNIILDEYLDRLLKICFNSTKQISFTAFLKRAVNVKHTFFCCDEGNVLLVEDDGFYILKKILKEEIEKLFSELLNKLDGNYIEFPEKNILVSDLETIKEAHILHKNFASTNILNEVFGQEVANVIIGALTVGEDYYSIVSIDKDSESIKVDNLILISSEQYLIEITPTILELKDSVQFKGVSYDCIKNKINMLTI